MRIRIDVDANYRAIFFNGKTIRQALDISKPIKSPKFAEIEDVAINNKCLAHCSYCYTSALKTGTNFLNIIEKAKSVWGERELNDRPFQIAIGGAGESTLHPDWIEFVKTVKDLEIVPNYTTNGMHLSNQVLSATEEYCGGVAISYHPHIEKYFYLGIEKLSKIKTTLNVHLIVGNKESFSKTKEIFNQYQEKIEYFVLLPYQVKGRAIPIETESTWGNMFYWIDSLSKTQQNKFAFGAMFYPYLKKNKIDLDIDIYEPEIYSGYRIFDETYMNLRKSSYDTTFK